MRRNSPGGLLKTADVIPQVGGTLSTLDVTRRTSWGRSPPLYPSFECQDFASDGKEGRREAQQKPTQKSPKAIFLKFLLQKPAEAKAGRKKTEQRALWLRSGELEDKIPRPSIGLIPRGPGGQQKLEPNIHEGTVAGQKIDHATYCCETCVITGSSTSHPPGSRLFCGKSWKRRVEWQTGRHERGSKVEEEERAP